MGLKYYSNPDSPVARHAALVDKVERDAARQRSTIRREHSIRPGRDQSLARSYVPSYAQNRREGTHAELRRQRRFENEARNTTTTIEDLEAQLQELRRRRAENRDRESDLRERWTSARGRAPAVFDELLRHDSSGVLHFNQGGVDETVVPPHASSDPAAQRTQVLPLSPRDSSDSPRAHSVRPSADALRPLDGPVDVWDSYPPLTSGFAPAHAAAATSRNGMETPPPDATFPTLRRMPAMSPRPLPRQLPPLSSLGLDTAHSSSSSSHTSGSPTHEQSSWNTLLSTIAPPSPSATNSSHTDFSQHTETTSSSAATSFASHYDSQETSLTSSTNLTRSFGEITQSPSIRSGEACDNLPPGITAADVRRIRERHGRAPRDRTRRPMNRTSATNPLDVPRSTSEELNLLEDHVTRTYDRISEQWDQICSGNVDIINLMDHANEAERNVLRSLRDSLIESRVLLHELDQSRDTEDVHQRLNRINHVVGEVGRHSDMMDILMDMAHRAADANARE